MNRVLLSALLACTAAATCGALQAQARGPANRAMHRAQPAERPPVVLDEAARASRIAAMQAWLDGLVGRYRVEGRQVYAGGRLPFEGIASCEPFGKGPGVRCLIERTTPTPAARSSILRAEGAREDMSLPLMYLGIRTDLLEIQAMVVDREQVTAQSGVLTGNSATFSDNWNACLKLWAYCWMVSGIDTGDGAEILMNIAVDHWYQGSKGLPIGLLKSGHTTEFELALSRQ